MQEYIKINQSIFKRRLFCLVVILIIFIVVYVFNLQQKNNEDQQAREKMSGFATEMSSEQLQKAKIAFENGITIEDAKDDFIMDAELIVSGYQIPQFDIKSISLGVDDEYLYRKCSYWAVSQEDLILNGHGDIQMNCTNALYIDRQQDISTEWGKGQYHMLTTNYDYAEKILGIELFVNIPEGATEEEFDYPGNPHNLKRSFGGLVFGGPGYDYVLAAWPLSELGLKKGDLVTLFTNTEEGAKSDKTHFAVDMVPQGNQKDGTKIKWIVGQKNYKIEL